MDAPLPSIRFGELLDTFGPAVESGEWKFVPALVELQGYDAGFEFASDPSATNAFYPRDADAAFVRARIPRVFGYTPVYDDSNEKCLLWEGFVAVSQNRAVAMPFICSDHYGKSMLFFSETGPELEVRKSISTAFWQLISEHPADIEDFEQAVFHPGTCCTMVFGCDRGEPYVREE